MAVTAWLLVLAQSRWLPLLAGIAPFVRPELALLSALLLWRPFLAADVRRRTQIAAMLALGALPFAGWSLWETGHLFPNTVGAKLAFFGARELMPVSRLRTVFVALVAAQILPLFAGLAAARDTRLTRAATLQILAVLAAALVTEPGALFWNNGRYLAPLVPMLLLMCMQLTHRIRGPLPALAVGIYALALAPSGMALLQGERANTGTQLHALELAARRIPAATAVLIHDAGMIAWVAPQLHLVDAVGLKTPDSSVSHQRWTTAICQWDRALDEIAHRSGASYAIVLQRPMWDCVGTNLVRAGWSAQAVRVTQAAGDYRLFALSPPPSARAGSALARP